MRNKQYLFLFFKIFLIVFFTVGGIYYGISCTKDKPERLYTQAITATANGNIELANSLYRTIVDRYPNSNVRKDALYQLGLLDYLYLNDYTTALEHFYDLVYTYPHYKHTFDAYIYIASIYKEKQHAPQKAIEVYNKLLKNTNSKESLKKLLPELASCYESISDIPMAINMYEQLLKLYDMPPANLLYEFAYLNYLTGNYKVAIKNFQKVCQLYPKSSYEFQAQLSIVDCYEETGNLDEALSLLNNLKSMFPTETSILDVKIDSVSKRIKNKK